MTNMIIGYLKNDNGSYVFKDDSGAEIPATGPAAQAKAQQLDAHGAAPGPGLPPPGQSTPTPTANALPAPTQPAQPSQALVDAAQKPQDMRLAMGGDEFYGAEGAPAPIDNPDAVPSTGPSPIGRALRRFSAAMDVNAPEWKKKADMAAAEAPSAPVPPAAPPPAPGAIPPGQVQMKQRPAGDEGPTMGGLPVRGLPGGVGGGPAKVADVRTGYTTQHTEITPEAKALEEGAHAQNLAAVQMGTDAEKVKNDQLLTAMQGHNRELAEADQAAQTQEAARQAEIKSRLARVDQLNQEVANSPIDEKAFWKDKSGPEKVMAAIAVGFGAFAAGMNGGPNHAANIIDRAIEQNIDAQKANKQGKQAEISNNMMLLDKNHEILGDQRAADAQTRMQLLQRASQHVDEVMQENKNPETIARGEAIKAALQEKYADAQATRDAVVMHENYARVVTGGAGRPAPLVDMDQTKTVKLDGKDYNLQYLTPEAAATTRTEVTDLQAASSVGRRILATDPSKWSPEDRAKMESAIGQIDALHAKAYGTGIRAAKEVLEAIHGGKPNALTNIGGRAALVEALDSGDRLARAKVVAGGGIPTRQNMQYDLKTNRYKYGVEPTGEAPIAAEPELKQTGQ
jgi:hypothetical protein